MQDLPHLYHASAIAEGEIVRVTSPDLDAHLETAAPVAFGGPGDRWSPETLFTAAIANCFILTFKSVARASRFEWEGIECDVEATLDKGERGTQFTEATVKVKLTVADADAGEKAERVLQKAEANCLVANSLNTKIRRESEVLVAA